MISPIAISTTPLHGRGVITIMRTRWDIIAVRHLLPFIRYVMYDILIARPHTSAYINLPFTFFITPIPGGAPESPKSLGVDSPLDIFALGSLVHTWRCRIYYIVLWSSSKHVSTAVEVTLCN